MFKRINVFFQELLSSQYYGGAPIGWRKVRIVVCFVLPFLQFIAVVLHILLLLRNLGVL